MFGRQVDGWKGLTFGPGSITSDRIWESIIETDIVFYYKKEALLNMTML